MIATITVGLLLAAGAGSGTGAASFPGSGAGLARGASVSGVARSAVLLEAGTRRAPSLSRPRWAFAQGEQTPAPPPLIEAEPEAPAPGAAPAPAPTPEPRGRAFGERGPEAEDDLTFDRYANRIVAKEVFAVAGGVLLFQVGVAAGLVGSFLLMSIDNGQNPVALFAGISGALLFGLTGLAWPAVAAWIADSVAPSGYRAGSPVRAGLFAFAADQVLGLLLFAPTILIAAATLDGGTPDVGMLIGAGIGYVVVRLLVIGVATSYGLHAGPPRPRGLEPRAPEASTSSRRPPNPRTTPTERALAERRVPGVALVSLAF